MSRIAAAELKDWVRHQSKGYLEQVVLAMAAQYIRSSTSAHELEPGAVETVKDAVERWRQATDRRKTMTPARAVEFLLGKSPEQGEFFLDE